MKSEDRTEKLNKLEDLWEILNRQVIEDADLWATLKLNRLSAVPDRDGSQDFYVTRPTNTLEIDAILACDPDPREAVRKAKESSDD